MPYTTDHQQKFTDLRFHIANQDQLKRRANGGNSILFTYPPAEEQQYIEKAKELHMDNASFIDVSKLLVQFIDKDGWDSFSEYYIDFRNTPHLVFRSDDPTPDLFDMIISAIENACREDKIPFLIRTGCLFGTGIDNYQIERHKIVMGLSHPLVIFYPSTFVDCLKFLGIKMANKYRSVIVK